MPRRELLILVEKMSRQIDELCELFKNTEFKTPEDRHRVANLLQGSMAWNERIKNELRKMNGG